MRARAAVVIPMLTVLAACDPLGSVGGNGSSIPFGFVGFPSAPLQSKLAFDSSGWEVPMRVGEGRHFTLRLESPAFERVILRLVRDAESGRAEFLGFVCDPVTSCAIERMEQTLLGPEASLRLYGARTVTGHIVASREGPIDLSARGDGPSCGARRTDCGTGYVFLPFTVVP
jgi:hypothetical protein